MDAGVSKPARPRLVRQLPRGRRSRDAEDGAAASRAAASSDTTSRRDRRRDDIAFAAVTDTSGSAAERARAGKDANAWDDGLRAVRVKREEE